MIRILALAYLSLLLLGLSDNMRGPLYPEILKEFSLSDTEGSLFFSLSSLMGFFGGLSSPLWIKKWGRVGTLRVTLLMNAIALLGFSFSPSFFTLICFDFMFGMSVGVMGVVQNALVVTHSPVHLRNRILSGLHSMYALASLVAPLIVNGVVLLGANSVWRLSFQIGAGFGVVILFFSLFNIHDNPEIATAALPKSKEGFGQQIYFGVVLASYVVAEILVSSRIAQYMREQFLSDLATSAQYTAGFFVALLAGRGLFTFWSPRISLKLQLMLSLVLTFVSMLVGIIFHPIGLVASGLFMAPFYPLMMVEAGRLFHKNLNQALAVTMAFSSLFVVIMHLLVGILNDQFGIVVAFSVGPFFCALSFVMLGLHEKVFYRVQS